MESDSDVKSSKDVYRTFRRLGRIAYLERLGDSSRTFTVAFSDNTTLDHFKKRGENRTKLEGVKFKSFIIYETNKKCKFLSHKLVEEYDREKQILVTYSKGHNIDKKFVFSKFRKFGYIDFLKQISNYIFIIEFKEIESINDALKSMHENCCVESSQIFFSSCAKDSIDDFEKNLQLYLFEKNMDSFETFCDFRQFGSIGMFKRATNIRQEFTGPCFITYNDEMSVNRCLTALKENEKYVKKKKFIVENVPLHKISKYLEYHNHQHSTQEYEKKYKAKFKKSKELLDDYK